MINFIAHLIWLVITVYWAMYAGLSYTKSKDKQVDRIMYLLCFVMIGISCVLSLCYEFAYWNMM